jgi:hypothetical protein
VEAAGQVAGGGQRQAEGAVAAAVEAEPEALRRARGRHGSAWRLGSSNKWRDQWAAAPGTRDDVAHMPAPPPPALRSGAP